MVPKISIALDGPAGSGKSTVAKLVAKEFGYIYIDTGAMYRALTLKALSQNLDLSDDVLLTQMAESTEVALHYEFSGNDSLMRVLLDGTDVSETIRSLAVTEHVSVVAAVAGVRNALVTMQRKMAESGGVVMDGRDIGTVVLPHAELKVYLTASVAERGKRRWLELKAKGVEVELTDLTSQIEKRDYFDSHREINPLCQAEDAVFLDTTSLSLDGVVEYITSLAVQRGASRLLNP